MENNIASTIAVIIILGMVASVLVAFARKV
jgi:Na+-transporting NADH:ubiquinone oxidoreductase subunit NqrC